MTRTINFNMSLDSLIEAVNALNMSYHQLNDLFDINSVSWETLEKEYYSMCMNMSESERADERYNTHLELLRAIKMQEPVVDHPDVAEWLYKGGEMPPEVLAIYEAHSAECMAFDVMVSKMAVVCKACPEEMFHKYYPNIIQTL